MQSEEQRLAQIRRFSVQAGIAVALLVAIPPIFGWLGQSGGTLYLGQQTNADDNMVYAAWMRQAMEGRLLFDNRFAIDTQPGLSFHLYFLVLGWAAKLFGLIATPVIARVVLAYAFVRVATRFLLRLNLDVFTTKLALTLMVLGGGFGFLIWHEFGRAISRDSLALVGQAMQGLQPIDVWQPEAFVFPSLLTNGLFSISLILILLTFTAVLDSRESPRPVLAGAVCLALLMNIHSYDVVLISCVLAGLLVCAVASKRLAPAWLGRTAVIACGAIPAALWFAYVYQNDPVFQARAATETFSPSFRQIIAGIAPALICALIGMWLSRERTGKGSIALALLFVALIAGWVASSADTNTYWLGPGAWIAAMIVAMTVLGLLATGDVPRDLLTSWALIGLVMPYFPALFQRKLAMGLMVPWAVLAALGVAALIRDRDRARRNMVTAVGILVTSISSLMWLQRELRYLRANVSSTTMHPVYLSQNASRIIETLGSTNVRKVVAAMPGIAQPGDQPDKFLTPYLPDLNPFASGLAGAYTYAGHWSETPNYAVRRANLLSKLFSAEARNEDRQQLIRDAGLTHVIAPIPSAFPELQAHIPLADLKDLGAVLVDGPQFRLIEIRR